MTPKKKAGKPATKKKTASETGPLSLAPPPPPPPPMTPPQRRFWLLVSKRSFIGSIFFALGVGILGGHWFYHREWHTPSFVGSMVLMLLGALLLDPTSVKDALGTLGATAKDLLPFTRKPDPPAGGA